MNHRNYEDLYDAQVTDLMKQTLARNEAKEIADAQADVARQRHDMAQRESERRGQILERVLWIVLAVAVVANVVAYVWGSL